MSLRTLSYRECTGSRWKTRYPRYLATWGRAPDQPVGAAGPMAAVDRIRAREIPEPTRQRESVGVSAFASERARRLYRGTGRASRDQSGSMYRALLEESVSPPTTIQSLPCPSHGRKSNGSSSGATDSQCIRAGTLGRTGILRRASVMFSTVAPSQTCGQPCEPQPAGSILAMFCRRLVRISHCRLRHWRMMLSASRAIRRALGYPRSRPATYRRPAEVRRSQPLVYPNDMERGGWHRWCAAVGRPRPRYRLSSWASA